MNASNAFFMGQPIKYGQADNPPKQVRLWDMFTPDQKKNLVNWLPSQYDFNLARLQGDARGWVIDMETRGRITHAAGKADPVRELAQSLGAKVVRAQDGKMAMVANNQEPPVSGRYPPGTMSVEQFAEKMLTFSNAMRDTPPDWQMAEKVEPMFADYLESVGEIVVRDTEGTGCVWLSRDRADQDRVMQEAWLTMCGANQLATTTATCPLQKAASRLYPREYHVWDKGLASAWLVADSVRYRLGDALQNVTGGSFSMSKIGGRMVNAMRECQNAMESMVETRPEHTLASVRSNMEMVWGELEKTLAEIKGLPAAEEQVGITLASTFDAINFSLQELEAADLQKHRVPSASFDKPSSGDTLTMG